MAEGILIQKVKVAGLSWIVESAGTNRYHIDEAPHPLSQKVTKMNGIDISKQKARRFTPDDFDNYDLIYPLANDVLSEIRIIASNKFDESKVMLLMNELLPGKNIDVPDPWYGPEPGYHVVFNMLEEVCERIINKYKSQK
jgi:protein-tyrosine phosphatase